MQDKDKKYLYFCISNHDMMNRRIGFLAAALAVLLALPACGEKATGQPEDEKDTFSFDDHSGKTVKTLKERQTLVYWGWDTRWHEITDPKNQSKWDYVRTHVTGFYTNFIDMWKINFQNSLSPQQTLRNLYDTFEGKSAFFEATMETKVNDSATGYNNEETDRRTIDQLSDAGFSVDYTSVNYMTVSDAAYCKERMKLVATYRGKRKCLYLCGPWCFGGSIRNDKDAMEMCTWGDGTQTDGPLGFWYANQNKMKETSYSIVKQMDQMGKETAIMLAPYYAGIDAYDPRKDFLKVSKSCVLGHEDADAMPQIWTLWMYGAGGMDLFPECTSAGGIEEPACSGTGVAWWLLKHLNEFPVLNYGGEATESVKAGVPKGEVVKLTLTFSNRNCPNVELSPVLRAVFDTRAKGWHYKFVRKNNDVTDDVVFRGGLNCKGGLRIQNTNPLSIDLYVKADEGAAPLTIDIEAMSNASNTVSKKNIARLTLQPE